MNLSYDNTNIFAKILKGEIPCNKVFEDEYSLAFHDINPKAPVHILVIPKGEFISFYDFMEKASKDEVYSFFTAVRLISDQLDISNTGFRIISNHGSDGGQEVPHFHIHLLGKQQMNAV